MQGSLAEEKDILLRGWVVKVMDDTLDPYVDMELTTFDLCIHSQDNRPLLLEPCSDQ